MEVGNGGNNPVAIERNSSAAASSGVSGAEVVKCEAARLRTFANWPLSYISTRDLAKAGFIYTGKDDCVKCVFCGEYVDEWEPTDHPAREHRNLFSHCPFIQGKNVGNIPMLDGESADIANLDTLAEGEDEVGLRPRKRDRFSGPERSVLHWNPSERITSTSHDAQRCNNISETGILLHSGPANSKFTTTESRLRSFREWPPALRQKPKELAEAGFYYIGLSDQVKCFYCDGGLRNWEAEDEPWTEHARWFSKCAFVRLIKGDDFIMECINLHQNEDSNEEILDPYLQSPSTRNTGSDEVSDTHISPENQSQRAQPALSKESGASNMNTAEALVDTESRLRDVRFSDDPPPAAVPKENVPVTNPHENIAAEAAISTAPNKTRTGKLGANLEEENQRLRDQRICRICMDNDIGVVFLPCGHLICCVQCAPSLKDCPLCRKPIHGTVKTYMS